MRQQRAEETRQKILAAAIINFSRTGYESASVADICAQAGVTKGAFYHHFPSKQSLFLEILEVWLTALDAMLGDAQKGATNVPQALEQMAGKTTLIIAESKELLPMFLEFWNQALRDPIVWEMTIAPYRRYNDFFTGLLRKGVQEGSIIPIDPEVTGRLIVSMALGLILQGMMDPSVPNWDKTMHDALITFFKAIEKGH